MSTRYNSTENPSSDREGPIDVQAPIPHSPYAATYSPDDNKLRLYSAARLPRDVYARVRAAGFRWAPTQGLFLAPTWTPEREDTLLELCGDIGDEDESLTEQAMMRAERVKPYDNRRADETQKAREGVSTIVDHLPLGQPVPGGAHGEWCARQDRLRIESEPSSAVRRWDTSAYWMARAAGALRHAMYAEQPDVRARRIQGIEADHRKWLRCREESSRWLNLWQRLSRLDKILTRDGRPTTLLQRALFLSHRDRTCPGTWGGLHRQEIAPEQAQARLVAAHTHIIARATRWIAHCEHRLAYERAMLSAARGIAAAELRPEAGGACVCWASQPHGWSYIQQVNPLTVAVLRNWGSGGRNFIHTVPFDKLSKLMSAAQVQEQRDLGRLVEFPDKTGFALSEASDAEAPNPNSAAMVNTLAS